MNSPKPAAIPPGPLRALRALRYSVAGLRACWRHEEAFRQELLLALGLIPAALWLGQSALERALLAGSVLLVLTVEVLNSAIEAVVDRHGAERHPLAGRAKDMGSAAVFLALCNAALMWGLWGWERWWG